MYQYPYTEAPSKYYQLPSWLSNYYSNRDSGLFGSEANKFFESRPVLTYSEQASQNPISYYSSRPRSFDTNAPEMEDIEAELAQANEFSTNSAFSGLNPGRSDILGMLSTVAPAPFSVAISAINNLNAYNAQAFNQELANVAQNRSVFDTVAESLGFAYSEGIGGYGRGGRGGYTGAMDYTDPGVAGPARASARSALNAAVGLSIDPAPGTQGWSDAVDDLAGGIGANEAPGGIDYSGEVGGYNSGGGDAGGDAGTYICTAAYANGVTDYSTFSANRKYGINLRRNDPYLMKGYDLVGPTYAKWFGNNNVGKTLTTYYKKSVKGERLNWKYKLLEKFLLYINRPALRTLGYLHERISGKG